MLTSHKVDTLVWDLTVCEMPLITDSCSNNVGLEPCQSNLPHDQHPTPPSRLRTNGLCLCLKGSFFTLLRQTSPASHPVTITQAARRLCMDKRMFRWNDLKGPQPGTLCSRSTILQGLLKAPIQGQIEKSLYYVNYNSVFYIRGQQGYLTLIILKTHIGPISSEEKMIKNIDAGRQNKHDENIPRKYKLAL